MKYADPDAFERETRREQTLRDLGLRMVRWLGREVMGDPGAVMARLRRALEEEEARPPAPADANRPARDG